jgi:hypothetical protein
MIEFFTTTLVPPPRTPPDAVASLPRWSRCRAKVRSAARHVDVDGAAANALLRNERGVQDRHAGRADRAAVPEVWLSTNKQRVQVNPVPGERIRSAVLRPQTGVIVAEGGVPDVHGGIEAQDRAAAVSGPQGMVVEQAGFRDLERAGTVHHRDRAAAARRVGSEDAARTACARPAPVPLIAIAPPKPSGSPVFPVKNDPWRSST